jgi:chaperone required for assembly of F1-ATPase
VLLDGRAPKSPAGAPLRLPTAALAGLVAEEWAAQADTIAYATMPATRLAFTAIDRTPHVRPAMAAEIAKYAGSDLLCYFADGPAALVERQAAQWGPLLDWADAELGIKLTLAQGILHRPQDPEALARAEALAAALDDFALTALVRAAGLFGSAVLAFALQRGRLSGEGAFALARLDEIFQEERWGVDAEAADRAAAMLAEAVALERWFEALA